MEYQTIAGNYYTVTSRNGCSVTDSTGTLNETVEAGKQLTVQAPSDKLIFDDEQAIVFKAPFKYAPVAAGILGGGKDVLAKGYTLLDFLEGTGTQYLLIPRQWKQSDTLQVKYVCPQDAPNENVFGVSTDLRLLNGPTRIRFAVGGNFYDFSAPVKGAMNIACYEPTRLTVNGVQKTLNSTSWVNDSLYFRVFAANLSYMGTFRLLHFEHLSDTNMRLVPALDSSGTPCMFDTVSKQSFKNNGSGQFIAGVKNASQLRTVLRKLPDRTGQETGSLTLSIPAEANTPEMQELLDTTKAQKNWELPIQERAAAVSTYMLRRVRKMVWVRRELSEYGSYVAFDGSRWLLEWCSAIYSPRGNDPTLHGYEPFGSVEEAAETWGLVPYEYPEEELSTIEA